MLHLVSFKGTLENIISYDGYYNEEDLDIIEFHDGDKAILLKDYEPLIDYAYDYNNYVFPDTYIVAAPDDEFQAKSKELEAELEFFGL